MARLQNDTVQCTVITVRLATVGYIRRSRQEEEKEEEREVRAATLDVAAPTADRSPIDPFLPRRSESYFRNLPAPEVLGARIVPGTCVSGRDVDTRYQNRSK